MRKDTMTIRFAAALAALIVSGTSNAHAEGTTFGEVGLSYDTYFLGGDALNSGGGFPNEPENFYGGRLSARAGGVQDNGLSWGVQGHYSKTSVGDLIVPGEETNDGPRDAAQIIATIGRFRNDAYVGLMAGVGSVRFTADDFDQDTNYRMIGAGIGFERGQWAYGGSLAFLDVISVDNPETLDNALIAKMQAEYALSNDKSFVGFYASYTDGENDVDSGSGADPVRGPGVGVYLRHRLGTWGVNNDVMLKAGIDYLRLQENGSAGDQTIASTKAFVGVTVTFGKSKEPRAIRMADIADTTYAQILTPYVD